MHFYLSESNLKKRKSRDLDLVEPKTDTQVSINECMTYIHEIGRKSCFVRIKILNILHFSYQSLLRLLNHLKENLNEDDEEKDEEDGGDDQLENDPFLARVGPEIPEDLQTKITNKDCMKQCVTWPNLGKVLSQSPKWATQKDETQKCLLDDEDQDGNSEKQLKLQEFQEKLVNVSMAEPIKDYFLTDQLSNNLAVANASNMKESKLVQPLNGLQSELLSLLATYKDVYFGQETLKNLEEVRLVYCAHALNHMLKTRNKILKNNAKLSKNPGKSAIDVRDQGLCRPKIVIVVPFKESARKVVEIMGKLMFGEVKRGNVSNKKRFDDEFGTEPKDLDKIKVCTSHPAFETKKISNVIVTIMVTI